MSTTYKPPLNLSQDQEELLMAALSTNQVRGKNNQQRQSLPAQGTPNAMKLAQFQTSPQLFQSPVSTGNNLPDLDSPYLEFDPDFDYDGSFDLDDNAIEGQMIGNLPNGFEPNGSTDTAGKRKSFDGYDEDEDVSGKRQETDDKQSKKPGRKALTSEPTTKRKAQNRAAQRAFRERKEKHLKDLETKVDDLEKASESANHENSLLRAQVDRLQSEVKIYRQRLRNNSGTFNRNSPPSGPPTAVTNNGNNFQFDFPIFGGSFASGNPTNHSGRIQSISRSPTVPNGTSSNSSGTAHHTPSPRSSTQRNNSYASSNGMSTFNGQQRNNTSMSFDDGADMEFSSLFSPAVLESASKASSDYMSHRGSGSGSVSHSNKRNAETDDSGTPQLIGGANAAFTASPSASSISQHGPGSSCGASPEPHTYPTPGGQNNLNTINEELSQINGFDGFSSTLTKTPSSDVNGINWLAQENGGLFNPDLFGDYRDPQNAIQEATISGDDYGGFFADALARPDFSSPYNAPDDASALTQDLAQEMDKRSSDNALKKDKDAHQICSMEKIWDRLAADVRFEKGDIDLDNLCTEFKAKAQCTQSGFGIEKHEMEKIMKKLPEKRGV